MERPRMSRAFNSRQSEVPQRIMADSNRMSMVNATPQNKQPSFGKLSTTKPQSGTSDRRISFFGNRSSGAGMPRNSSVFGAVGGEKIKDVRPLHDKAFVQQCIRQLCEFLSEKGFPGSLTTKSLQSPSTKEFLKVFEFVYCQLDPTFQVPTSKVEEEIPRLLKDLGYPFALSKSSMYSVGAPHTWPQVLGAMIWLIDTVKIYCSMSEQDLLLSDFSEGGVEIEDGVEYNKLFLDYTAETYNNFMQGADTFEDEDEVYLSKLKKLYNVDEALLASMGEKYRILSDEVDRLEKESQTDRLMFKRTEKVKLQTDLQKLQSYRSNLEAFKANLEAKASGLSEEMEAVGLQTETLKQEQARLQHVLQHQKFTPADIERINHEKRELQQTVSSLGRRLEEAQQHMWNEEIAMAKAKETREMELAEYHKLARKLKLIPASAENACGHDFEIRTLSAYGPSAMVQYKTQIQNPLVKLVGDVEEECSRLINLKLTMEESIEQVNSNISDNANELKELREQIRKMDERLEHEMQELARDEQKWAAEMESAENHKKTLEKKVALGYDEASEQLKTAQQQYYLLFHEINEEKRTVDNNLASIFSTTTTHMSAVENYFEDQRKRAGRFLHDSQRQNEAELQKIRDLYDSYMAKANY